MSNRVYVWDWFVRVFHWSLVSLFVFSFVTGELEHGAHVYSGYTIVTLVFLRIIWGFVGSPYARFSQFIYSPATVISYARDFFSAHPKRYLGHNPLGGVMMVALMAGLFMTGFSGMKLYAVEEGKGPLAVQPQIAVIAQAYADSDDDEYRERPAGYSEAEHELWEKIHPISVSIMLLLIVLHISGVVLSSRKHKESLIRSMLTGYKDDSDGAVK